MSTKQTTLFPPPLRGSSLSPPEQKYLFTLQMLGPLRVGDTTAAPYAEDLPNAGLDPTGSSGQSNQNQEIIYVKKAGGANAWTINGAVGGAVVITSDVFPTNLARFKSDGTNWWRAG